MINIQTYSEDVHQQYLFTKKQSLDDLRIYCGKDVLIKLLAAQSDINSGKLLKRKFCLDAYSMIKHYCDYFLPISESDHSQINQRRYEYVLRQNAGRLANMVLNFAFAQFVTEITIVFPQKRCQEPKSKNQNLLDYLIQLDNEDEISEAEALSMEIYSRIYSYMFSQVQMFYRIETQRNEKCTLKGLQSIRCPWINNKIIKKDPCAAQMAYFAKQNFTCFTWNEFCLQSIPQGVFVIGFNYTLFYKMYIKDSFYDKRDVWISTYDSEISNQSEYFQQEQTPVEKSQDNWQTYIKVNEVDEILYYSSKNLVQFKINKPKPASKYSLFSSNIFIQEAFNITNKNRYLVDFDTWSQNYNSSFQKAFIAYMMFQIHPILKTPVEKGIFKQDMQVCNNFKVIYEKNVDPIDEIDVYQTHSQNAAVLNENFQQFLPMYFPRTGLHVVFSSKLSRRTINNPQRSQQRQVLETERKLFYQSTTDSIMKTVPNSKHLNNKGPDYSKVKKSLFRQSTAQKICKITKLRAGGSKFTSDFDSDSDIEQTEQEERRNDHLL